MADPNISFYLKAHRIHVFVEALRGIDEPRFIRFMIAEDGETLVMEAYNKKDFHSHRVPKGVYNGTKGLEISSFPLCNILAQMYGWNPTSSYRIPGRIIPQQRIVIFYLKNAELIDKDEKQQNTEECHSLQYMR